MENDIRLTKLQSLGLWCFYIILITSFVFGGYYFYTDLFSVYPIEKEITMDIGNTHQIELLPKNSKYFDYKNYVYEVADEKIAKINELGEIETKEEGETEITIRFKKGYEKKKISLTVKSIEVTDLKVQGDIVISKNSSQKIKPTVNNDESISTKLIYISENENIATVDQNGNITGKKEGTTTIIVRSNNGIEKRIKVTVTASKEKIQEISIEEKEVTLKSGEKKQLTINTVPSNANTENLKWHSNNTSIATVDEEGVVTGKSAGYTVISVTTKEGLTAQTTITVKETEELILNSYNVEIEVGKSYELKANKEVKYTSSNPKIAVVDEKGNITGKKEGKTTIVVSSLDGKKNKCEVTVIKKKEEVEEIKLNKENISMLVGDTITLKATITPSSASKEKLSWTSSDNKIAKVDSNGKVTALKEGKVAITVTTQNDKKDTCTVLVKKVEATQIEIDRKNITMVVGASLQLNVKFTPSNVSDKTIKWSSGDTSIVEVNDKGLLKAKKEGTTTITATTKEGLSSTSNVTVQKNSIPVSSITLDKTKIEIKIGETATLKATIKPSNASVQTIEWKTSDSSIATVDSNGKVKGIGIGTTIINVESSNGKSAKCKITVLPVEVKSIKIEKDSYEVDAGSSISIKAVINPSNATVQTITWSSSNPSIAKVDSNGKVSGIKDGVVTITAESNNGKKSQARVTVKKVEVKTITLNKTEVNIVEGKTETLIATITPSNATDKSLTWKSEDTSIATVDQNGKISALKVGTTKIVVTSNSNNNVKSESIVNVKAKTIPVTSINLDKTNVEIYEGDTLKLTATITPTDATNKSVTWSSSDETIAKVDSNGKVTAFKTGSVTITAKSHNGKTATCSIKVNKKNIDVASIKIDNNISSMYIGDIVVLSVTISPENATNKKINWSSSNNSIATVDESGKVTAKSEGSVKITATSASNTSVSDYKTIVVNKKTVNVTSLSSNVSSYNIKFNESYQWNVIVNPSNATNKQITYTSSDTSIATVSSSGKITAKEKKGTVTITATSKENSSIKTTLKVTVSLGDPLNLTTGASGLKWYSGFSYYEVIPPHPTTNMPLVVYIVPNTSFASNPMSYVASKKAYNKEEFFFLITTREEYYNIKKIIDKIVNDYKIDKKRISISGYSYGALRTWETVNAYPKFFSAAVPISNGPYYPGNSNPYNIQASNFKTTQVWGFAGNQSGEANGWEAESAYEIRQFVSKIKSAGGQAWFTQKTGNHSAMQNTISDQEILNWMISVKNPNVK